MNNDQTNAVIEKIKALVRQGNASRVVVRKGDKIIANVPVTAGIGIGAAALLASKWLIIGGAIASVGFGCTVEIIKENDEVVSVLTEEDDEKVRCAFSNAVEEVKDKAMDVMANVVSGAKDAAETVEEKVEDIIEDINDPDKKD